MNDILNSFKQQSWLGSSVTTIHKGAIVAVDGVAVNTPREIALADTILLLNAQSIHLKKEIEALKENS
jgi:hypothetical protein